MCLCQFVRRVLFLWLSSGFHYTPDCATPVWSRLCWNELADCRLFVSTCSSSCLVNSCHSLLVFRTIACAKKDCAREREREKKKLDKHRPADACLVVCVCGVWCVCVVVWLCGCVVVSEWCVCGVCVVVCCGVLWCVVLCCVVWLCGCVVVCCVCLCVQSNAIRA